MSRRIDAILEFWFGDALNSPKALARQAPRWFTADESFDQLVRDRFNDDVAAAMQGELDAWPSTANGRLALVILLDQFTRNIHRGAPAAFAGDEQALRLCMDGIVRGHDVELHPVACGFLYMPMQHSEDIAVQERSVEHYASLLQRTPPAYRKSIEMNLDFARQHRDLIRRFGRFPHRNEVLGRAATPEEKEYLEGGGERFGQ